MSKGSRKGKYGAYADDKDAVYCCILNDYEVQLLKDGASFRLLQ